ncbi:oligosaccharide flippase family protein [candidate division KSB1 bacterium]|nr:oligosaccharide flippase family protein [candidate division KSB1 bacterium]
MAIFSSIKNLFKHSAVYGVGHILTRSINFLLMPLFTNLFPRDEYGVVGIMFAYIAILTIVYTYGLDAAFFRFYILKEELSDRRDIFSTSFITILLTSICFSALLFISSDTIVTWVFSEEVRSLSIDLALLVKFAAGILMFDALTFLPFLILRAEQRSIPFVVFKFINVLINVGCNVLFLIVLDFGIEGVFLANLIASTLTFFIMSPLLARYLQSTFSLSLLRELFAFGIPYLPSTLAVVIMDTIDRPFLERLASVEEAGLYNAGVKLGMFMALFVTAFRFAWHPFFLSTLKQKDAKAVFAKVFTYVLLACAGVFIVLSVFIEDIVRFPLPGFTLVGKEFWACTTVVPVLMLAYILYAAYLNFLIGVYLHKKTKYLPFITVSGMVGNLITNALLIPVIGMMGAAWARFVAYFIMAVSLYVVNKKLYPVDYEWKRIIKLCLITAMVFFVGMAEFIQSVFMFKLFVVLSFPVLLYIMRFFESNEINRLKMLWVSRKK